jgi:hypothetical protein
MDANSLSKGRAKEWEWKAKEGEWKGNHWTTSS